MAKLWLSDEEHSGEPTPAIAAIWRIDRKQQRVADDLKTLAAEIGGYDHLEELVLCYHGFPGGMIIDGHGYNLSDAPLKNAFEKVKTKIDRIRFEGCWVGQSPDEMAAFGRLFGSSTVSAFTWTSWTNTIEIKIPKGVTPEVMKQTLAPYEKWFVPNSVTMSLINMTARTGGKLNAGLLWYQPGMEMKPPYVNDNYKKLGAINFKARTEAVARTVAAKDAKPTYSPSPPLEYVTVQL